MYMYPRYGSIGQPNPPTDAEIRYDQTLKACDEVSERIADKSASLLTVRELFVFSNGLAARYYGDRSPSQERLDKRLAWLKELLASISAREKQQ